MLPKAIDPIEFWYRNAGRYLVSADALNKLGDAPMRMEIIDKTLAVAFPRSSSKPSRLVEFEGALIGEGWGFIYSKSLEPDASSAIAREDCPLIHEKFTVTTAGLLLEVLDRRPEPPFLALSFLKATGYAQASTICATETLDQMQICTVKDRIVFSRNVLDEFLQLEDRLGAKALSTAARARHAKEFRLPYYAKEKAALEKALSSKEAGVTADELVAMMPSSNTGEALALRLMLSKKIKGAK